MHIGCVETCVNKYTKHVTIITMSTNVEYTRWIIILN